MGICNSVPKDPTDIPALHAIRKKATHALNYAALTFGPTGPPENKGARIQGDGGELVDMWWSHELAELVVALRVPAECIRQDADESLQPHCVGNLCGLHFEEGSIHVAPSVSPVIDRLLNQKALDRVKDIAGGKIPRRVICTGVDLGGSVAKVAAVVLAVKFPSAEVRCVTVNAPIISYGNAAFADLYRYVVGFSYHLNTAELMTLLPPDHVSFPLYGQWAQSQKGSMKPIRYKPVYGSKANWSAEKLHDLVSSMKPVEQCLPKPPPVETERPKLSNMHRPRHIREAAVQAAVESCNVKAWINELYGKDPNKELSLRWTDEVTTVPFKKLDTVPKMLLVGKRVAAMAGLAAAAYSDWEGFCRKTGLQDAIFINRNGPGQKDGQAYVVYRPKVKTLLIAFRGSKGMLDALADLRTVHNRANFLDTVVKGASVHKGFYLQLVDMYPSLCEAIESLTTRPGEDSSIVQRIYVTGHSLGGAIASIGACMLAKKFAAADVSSITFASPRAGNAQFDAAFATLVSTSLRFVYNYDAVPTVPMPYLGFRHVDHCFWLKPGTSPKSKDGIDRDATLEIGGTPPHFPSKCVAMVGDDVIENHSMCGRYIGSLFGHLYRLAEVERGLQLYISLTAPLPDDPVPQPAPLLSGSAKKESAGLSSAGAPPRNGGWPSDTSNSQTHIVEGFQAR